MDGYWSTWDWNWWGKDNPVEEFENGTYDVKDMATSITYEMDGKELAITKNDFEWKNIWKISYPEKLYGKCFTFVPPPNVDQITFYNPIGDLMNGPYLPNLKIIFHTETKVMNQVGLFRNSLKFKSLLGLKKRILLGQV